MWRFAKWGHCDAEPRREYIITGAWIPGSMPDDSVFAISRLHNASADHWRQAANWGIWPDLQARRGQKWIHLMGIGFVILPGYILEHVHSWYPRYLSMEDKRLLIPNNFICHITVKPHPMTSVCASISTHHIQRRDSSNCILLYIYIYYIWLHNLCISHTAYGQYMYTWIIIWCVYSLPAYYANTTFFLFLEQGMMWACPTDTFL